MKTEPLSLAFFLVLLLLNSSAVADEVTLAEANVSFKISSDWFHKLEKSRAPPGFILQRWVHKPIEHQGRKYMPGITAWATPVNVGSNLVPLTKETLKRFPFQAGFGDVECLKCARATFPWKGQTVSAISHEDWPECELGNLDDFDGTCIFQRISLVELNIEPSLVLRFRKSVESTEMDVIVIPLITDLNLVVISFWYPFTMRAQLQEEIFAIIQSIKTND